MLHKTWNVRDQTDESLRVKAERLYNKIEAGYKKIKTVSSSDDAKKLIEKIWIMKEWANDIELELIRREYTNEAQKADAGTH